MARPQQLPQLLVMLLQQVQHSQSFHICGALSGYCEFGGREIVLFARCDGVRTLCF